jgi:AraC-like DNA-binding protein
MAERLFLRLDGDPLYAPETTVPAGTMREFAVLSTLRSHVSNLAVYRETIPDGQELVERVLPDGAVHLIFQHGEPPCAAGPVAAPVMLTHRGRMDGLSVTLRPGAAAALLGVPPGEITGSAVALEDLWGGDVLEQIAQAPNDAARVALLQHALQQRLRMCDTSVAQRQAAHAVKLIADAGGQRALRDVAEAVGVGERRLQQIFRAEVGLSPGVWNRLARLHACLRALRRPQAPHWAGLALDAGFYDQSHLVNEFRSLCGLTPGQFVPRAVSVSSKTQV